MIYISQDVFIDNSNYYMHSNDIPIYRDNINKIDDNNNYIATIDKYTIYIYIIFYCNCINNYIVIAQLLYYCIMVFDTKYILIDILLYIMSSVWLCITIINIIYTLYRYLHNNNNVCKYDKLYVDHIYYV